MTAPEEQSSARKAQPISLSRVTQMLLSSNTANIFAGSYITGKDRSLSALRHHRCSLATRPSASLIFYRHVACRNHQLSIHCRQMPFLRALWSQSTPLQRRGVASASKGSGQSLDSDEEGDTAVAQELAMFDGDRVRSAGRHLELMWNFNQKTQPERCSCCRGSGKRNCQYCHNTGAMMVGHERFCSLEAGCKACPVCNGLGDVKCSHCQGTGFRAGWLD